MSKKFDIGNINLNANDFYEIVLSQTIPFQNFIFLNGCGWTILNGEHEHINFDEDILVETS